MKVAFVVPRYGMSVFGGAEVAARQLAERISRQRGISTEVFTTCALDHTSWRQILPPGDSLLNGVLVHRFHAQRGRDPQFDEFYARLAAAPASAGLRDTRRWVEMQGPVSPELVDAVCESGSDAVAFYPYLYYPTVFAIGKAPMPAVLHPAAHDEPAFEFSVFRATFRSADALVYHTVAERELVERTHPIAARPQMVLGLGVGPPWAPQRPGGEVAGVGDRPYIVSLGRVDAQKGSRMLVRYFRSFKARHPGPLALVMVGPINEQISEDRDVIITGPVSEQDKWDILRGAHLLVSASPYESFSLAVMEGAAVRLPALVNAACGATREFCERSKGGLAFTSYRHFEVALERLLEDDELRSQLGQAGEHYVQRHYAWEAIIDRYAGFLEEVASRGRMTSPLVTGAT